MNDQTNDNPHNASASDAHKQARLIDDALLQFQQMRSTAAAGEADSEHTPGVSGGISRIDIPGYSFVGTIHRGGQGVVFRAVQSGTRRHVAIKAPLHGAFQSASEQSRFEREIRILGQLHHPNIVGILHSGNTEGQDYFVMDYIEGASLDDWVREKKPNLRRLLEVFGAICDAVAAAHLRGVIHRDLKPGNIRVDEHDVPHVLDFGLSKSHDGDEWSHETATGQFLGSLPWASPEQVRGQRDLLDVRTDVYSLGVLLYQMLTGRFPYIVAGPPSEVLDAILNAEPTPLRTLRADIPEDVQTIVLTCLQKDPERRYQSGAALQRDVTRWLRSEPIEARRDSISYMVGKLLSRHRFAVGVGAAFVLLLLAGFIVSFSEWRRAEFALKSATAERLRATRQANRAETANAFLRNVLEKANPELSGGPQVTMEDVLREADRTIEAGELSDEPLVAADVRATIGASFLRLGQINDAERHFRWANEVWNSDPAAGLFDRIRGLRMLTNLERAKGNAETALAHCCSSLSMLDAVEEPKPLWRADILSSMGQVLQDLGRLDESLAAHEEALAIERAELPEGDLRLATTLNNLALPVRDAGDTARSEALLTEALAILRTHHGNEHLHVAGVTEAIGSLRYAAGDMDAALSMYRESLRIRQAVVGAEHPAVATSMNNLGFLLSRAGQMEEAEAMYRRGLEIRCKVLGGDHPLTASTMNNLALLLVSQKRFEEAETLYRAVLDIRRGKLGEAHPNTINSAANLVSLLREQGAIEDALALCRATSQIADAELPRDHWHRPRLHAEIGACLQEMGRLEEAEPEYLQGYYGLQAHFGAEHARTKGVAAKLATLYDAWGDVAIATDWHNLADDAVSDTPLSSGE